MGGSKSRKYDKAAIVPLCHQHHEDVTTGGRKDAIVDGWYIVKNKRGNVIVKKEMPDEGIAGGVGDYDLNPTVGTGNRHMDFERTVDADRGDLAGDVVSEGALAWGGSAVKNGHGAEESEETVSLAAGKARTPAGTVGNIESECDLDAEVSPRQANNGVLPELYGDVEGLGLLQRGGYADKEPTNTPVETSRNETACSARKEGVLGGLLQSTDYAAWCSRLDRIGTALHSIRGLKSQATWEAGDAALEGERLFGHDSAQDMDRLGLKPKRLANIMWVCERIPDVRRYAALEFGTHEIVAALSAEDQEMWLELAQENRWKRGQLREAIHGPKVKVKRWTLEELRNDYERCLEQRGSLNIDTYSFLDWLEAQ